MRSTTALPASPFPRATQSRPSQLPAHPSHVCKSGPVYAAWLPRSIEDCELSDPAVGVPVDEYVHGLSRRCPALEQREPSRSVSRVTEGLRRHHADVGLPIGDQPTHARKLRLNGDTKIAIEGIAAENRECHWLTSPGGCLDRQYPATPESCITSCRAVEIAVDVRRRRHQRNRHARSVRMDRSPRPPSPTPLRRWRRQRAAGHRWVRCA